MKTAKFKGGHIILVAFFAFFFAPHSSKAVTILSAAKYRIVKPYLSLSNWVNVPNKNSILHHRYRRAIEEDKVIKYCKAFRGSVYRKEERMFSQLCAVKVFYFNSTKPPGARFLCYPWSLRSPPVC